MGGGVRSYRTCHAFFVWRCGPLWTLGLKRQLEEFFRFRALRGTSQLFPSPVRYSFHRLDGDDSGVGLRGWAVVRIPHAFDGPGKCRSSRPFCDGDGNLLRNQITAGLLGVFCVCGGLAAVEILSAQGNLDRWGMMLRMRSARADRSPRVLTTGMLRPVSTQPWTTWIGTSNPAAWRLPWCDSSSSTPLRST